jgi:hypothetical protein
VLRYVSTKTEGGDDLLVRAMAGDLAATWVAGEVFVARCFAEVKEEESCCG